MSFPARETQAGTVISVVLSLLSMATLSVCLFESILTHTSSTSSECARLVQATPSLLVWWVNSSKRASSRLKDKLYLFNSFGMLLPYVVVIALNFYFRFADYEERSCRIGMKRVAMIPLIAFDILVNVSLLTDPTQTRLTQMRYTLPHYFLYHSAPQIIKNNSIVFLPNKSKLANSYSRTADLHWKLLYSDIERGDNASTHTQIPNFQPSSDPSSPRRLVPRPPISDMEAYHMGLRDLSRKSGVTTMVTAKDYDDLELKRINSMPPNVVTIETEHTREVSKMKPDTQYNESDLDLQRVRAIGSKEETFGREKC
ncbi:uncharacterized protein RCO7_14420 [Rhynchosporium graminicola]|uniref:Uncharacterized protein n=1 Tax=Rhynchosporium graminicola TaxID=2792576 RepID=A0A1E1KF45_9HELO|nr:uncharacterized protein RCO7_14420 [Rhynchosporium commune]